jgi:hypothetical protein
MILSAKASILIAAVLLTASAPTQAQTTTKETTKGTATVTTSQLTGEVLSVEGNDLAVKLSTGEARVFHVPPTRKFVVDGKELSVGELQPGTTLTATVKTTTTPVTVRTKTSIEGKVWYASPPNVILTLSTGENKAYTVKDADKDKVVFSVRGQPATVFELKKGMQVSASKIVEEPDTEIVTDTTVTGHAPVVAAAKEPEAPPTPTPTRAPEPETTKPATPEPASSTPAPPAAASSEKPVEPAPAAAPSGISTEPVTAPAPRRNSLLWAGLVAVAAVIIVIVMRGMRAK